MSATPNKNNVMAGKPKINGAVFRAPLGTPYPIDARTELSEEFVHLGYVSSDGWSRQISKAYSEINAWGGDQVKKSRTEHSVSFNLSLIETLDADTQTAKWGEAAITRTEATEDHGNLVTISYSGEDTESAMWIFDMNDEGRLRRTVFFSALDTTESFEETYSDEDVIALPFEMSAYKDPDTGLFFIDYLDDGQIDKEPTG
ncbi:MAG: hypothetical protein FWG15_02785 [Propionibacteriaceae bacterium]|nr:hypothetical protein [Propionibacteriaceae bacterium]